MLNLMKYMVFRDRKKDIVKDMAIGVVIGAVAGILLAPKPGKETREDLKRKSKEIAENAKLTVEEKVNEAGKFTEELSSELEDSIEEAKDAKDELEEDIIEGYSDVRHTVTVKEKRDDLKRKAEKL